MKRLFSLITAVALVLSLAGCSGSGNPENTVTSADSPVSSSGTETTVSQEVSEDKDNDADIAGDNETSASTDEKDELPDIALRDAVEAKAGMFVGCAVTGSEIDDEQVWEIITTHFNRVTLGNELKPDALFNYSVSACPGKETVTFNGEELEVPKLDYSRAEKILNKFLEWNRENPDREIKIRGHVLVWHSQTPEWFFHEEYNKTKPYVDKATMNKRLEWYISTVLTHFTGEDSKYKGLFYGWDVVNEAISDGTGGPDGIRTDAENSESLSEDRHGSNSSWYHIYQSNEFIINAFKYANKYAPADLELYYNDYNECNFNKRNNILKLLEAIKAEEGAPGEGTRIDAMGMQGHYSMDDPSSDIILASIKNYARVVGKVQITEMDITASSDYKGQEDQKEAENEKLRKRYNLIYFAIQGSTKIDYVDFEGFTFWGTVDHYSWLQSRSNVGGGNTTGLPQMPLLFDENYEPKPCFYVFANTK
ncbi:MAG: endo-1,4-beta-xylanase [Lachnospiraceae bacterium]|nr:endo-1,4-beta-xylanase [Lachnospiraceae bacterium]